MISKIKDHIESGTAKRLGGEMGWVITGQALTALALVLGVRVLTEILPANIYGQVAIGLSIANLIAYFVGMELGGCSTRFFSAALEKQEFYGYFKAITGWGVCLLVAALFFAAVLFPFASDGSPKDYILAIVLGCFMASDFIFNGIQHAARNRRVIAFHSVLANLGRILLAVIVVVAFGLTSSSGVLIGFCIALLVNQVSQIIFLKRNVLNRYPEGFANKDGTYCSTHLPGYLIPRLFIGGLIWVQLFGDRLIISHFISSEAVGLYFSMYQLSFVPMLMLSSVVGSFVLPILFQRVGAGDDPEKLSVGLRQNEFVSLGLAVLIVVSFIMMLVLHRTVASVLVSESYRSASNLLPWMVLNGGLWALGSQLLASAMLFMDQKQHLLQRFICAVIAVAGYSIGATYGGLRGAVFGGLVFSISHVVLAFALHQRLKINLKLSS